VSTRPVVSAEPREVVGKKVSALRRQGILPAVVYGRDVESRPIQMDAHEFDVLRRTVTRNTLVDLKVGGGKATPVLLQGIHEHPVRRHAMHVDFFVVRMTEEIVVDVPVNYIGESHAADKLGGTLLHLRESVSVRSLPGSIPASVDLDITALATFDDVLHVSDIVVPEGVTLLTDSEEALARVQPPRVDEEAVVAEAAPGEGELPAEPAEQGEAPAAGEGAEESEG